MARKRLMVDPETGHYFSGKPEAQWLEVGMVEVESSKYSSHGYLTDQMWLFVEFPNGNVYRYDEFPVEQFVELCEAESKGSTFSRLIRGKPYEKILP